MAGSGSQGASEGEIQDKIASYFRGTEKLPMTFYVLDVLKFIHDGYSSPFRRIADPCCEGFDVILTDLEGKTLSKAFLGSEHNIWAQRQILRTGSMIKVTSVVQQSNINDMGASLLQHHLSKFTFAGDTEKEEVIRRKYAHIMSSKKYHRYLARPLLSNRRYYISHWSSGDPPVDWVSPVPQGDVPSKADMVARPVSLAQLVKKASATTTTCYSSVVGRVLCKSGVVHYAKPTDQKHASPFPYQFYIELGDDSCSVSVVFWNGNCPVWYNRVNVGDILGLNNFTIREVNDSRASTYNRLTNLRPPGQTTQVEINLNADRQPIAVVRLLEPADIPPSMHLPDVRVVLHPLVRLGRVVCPVVGTIGGVVCHCQRVERSHHTPTPPGSLQGRPPPQLERPILPTQQGKWVWLVDSSHPDPFPVHVTSCAQPTTFNALGVGSVLVITNAVIWRTQSQWTYGTCSTESQLYLVDRDCPSFLVPHVDCLREWVSSRDCRHKMATYSSPCSASAPPNSPSTISQLLGLLHSADSDIKAISIDEELWQVLDTLQHHQRRLLILTASVVEVRVTGMPRKLKPSSAHPKDSGMDTQAHSTISQGSSGSGTQVKGGGSVSQVKGGGGSVSQVKDGGSSGTQVKGGGGSGTHVRVLEGVGGIPVEVRGEPVSQFEARPVRQDEVWAARRHQVELRCKGAVGAHNDTGHPSWLLMLVTESLRTQLTAQFAPLPQGHWLNVPVSATTSPDPLRRMLGSGVAEFPALVERLEGLERGLFGIKFSVFMSAYHPGGRGTVQLSVLRAFALDC